MNSEHLGTLGILSLALVGWSIALTSDPPQAAAGCLAPRDVVVDVAGSLGPFWGNDSGDLMYSVLLSPGLSSERDSLRIRARSGSLTTVVEQGDSTGAFLGTESERVTDFHAGALNDDGDVAYVVSSASDNDDPGTAENETIARRALFFKRGGTTHRVARFGEPSPVLDGQNNPVPWASIFDASPSNRNPTFSEVVFSAQLGLPDGRTGVFVWDEQTQMVQPLTLEGDAAPVSGTFSTFGRTRVNGGGEAAFFALTVPAEGGTLPGLFLRQINGSVARIAVFGSQGGTPPEGGRFSILKDFDVDDAGRVTFASVLGDANAPAGIFGKPRGGEISTVLLEGDSSPLGGRYQDVSFSRVRTTGSGELLIGVPLSDDVGGDGVFSIALGTLEAIPLANAPDLVAVAALGLGAGGYQLESETHTVFPADGTEEGPTDFRITKLDVKNAVPLRQDSIKVDGRFRLPPFPDQGGALPPPTFRAAGVSVFSPTQEFTTDGLSRITQVRLQVSRDPGNTFVFGVTGADGTPNGSFSYNGIVAAAPKVKLGKSGRSLQWKFKSSNGNGKFTVDLEAGTFSLRLNAGSISPSFSPVRFPVQFTLQSEDDVAQARAPDASYFHRAVEIDADQPSFGSGRRVKSGGERVPGGTLFVDVVKAKRKLRVRKGVAAPDVTSDTIQLSGTLLTCPGSTAPTTPAITGDLTVGDLVFADVNLIKKGGAKYVFKSAKGVTPKTTLSVDVNQGTFVIKIVGAAPLSQLTDADFSGTSATNDSRLTVGGMTLPFSLSVARVYEASFDIPMVRQKGGKVFTR